MPLSSFLAGQASDLSDQAQCWIPSTEHGLRLANARTADVQNEEPFSGKITRRFLEVPARNEQQGLGRVRPALGFAAE